MTTTALRRPGAPAFVSLPPGRRGSYRDEVGELAETMRRPLDAAQLEAVDVLTAYGPGGRPLAVEACVVGPRQTTGKTAAVALPIVLFDAITGPADVMVWTAHQLDTAEKTFKDLQGLARVDPKTGRPDDPHRFVPELARRVRSWSEGNGDLAVTFTTGTTLEFRARSQRAGRGYSGRRVVYDEAMFLTDEQAGASLPLLTTRPDAQALYASSAAADVSEYLRRLVKRGRAGDASLAFVEWCAAGGWDDPGCVLGRVCDHLVGTPGCVLDDESLWVAANPAVATGRLPHALEFLRTMRRTLSPLEFGREFLGWHELSAGAGQTPITPGEWRATEQLGVALQGRPVMAAAVSLDGKSAAIGAAGWRAEDDRIHVELIDCRPGDAWLVARQVELQARHRPRGWAVDGKTAAAAHLPAMRKARLRGLREMTTSDCGAACAGLQSRVKNRGLVHLPDPVLEATVAGAQRRDIGDGLWAWAPKRSEVDVVSLVAITNAVWLLEQMPRVRPLVASR